MGTTKPLAVRMLEQRKIAHAVLVFDDSIRSASGVASRIGVAPELVYKTLVIEQDPPKEKPYLLMMPATAEVDLKRAAAALGMKKLRMASHRDAERHTGLQVGGISALALIGKGFPVCIESAALGHEEILVSAGQRGVDVRLSVRDLLALTGARVIDAAAR